MLGLMNSNQTQKKKKGNEQIKDVKILDSRGNPAKIKTKSEIWSNIAAGIFLFLCVGVISIISIGSYETFFREDITYTTSAESTWEIIPSQTYWTSELTIQPNSTTIIAEGCCVDKAASILSILKRHSRNKGEVQVALSVQHCQAVLNKNGKRTFLGLRDGNQVYETEKEFLDDEDVTFINANDFLEMTETYYPSMSTVDVIAFYVNKYAGSFGIGNDV